METQEKEKQFDTLKEEFTSRLGKEENKMFALRRDKDQLKKELQLKENTIADLTLRLETETKEKETLRQEKEKLEATIKELEQQKVEEKLEQQNTQLTSFQKQVESLEKSLAEVSSENEQNKKLIKDLKKEYDGDMEMKLAELNRKHESELLDLQDTIDKLRQSISKTSEEHEERIETLKRETESWMKQYRELEDRSQEFFTLVPDATKPLLEQINSLEKTTAAKASSFTEREKKYQTKLQIAENSLKISEQEISRLTKLNEKLKQNDTDLQKDVAEMKELLVAEKQRYEQERIKKLELEVNMGTLQNSLKRSQDENQYLEHQLNDLNDTIRKLQEEIEDNASKHQVVENPVTHSPVDLSQGSIETDLNKSTSSNNDSDITEIIAPANGMVSSTEFQEAFQKRDLKIKTLQERVMELEEIKSDLSERLAMYKQTNQTLATEINEKEEMLKQVKDLQIRYEAALDLIGEKEECIQTMQEEFRYVKETFRGQVNDLLKEIEILKSK